MSSPSRSIVILGGGFGGLYTALELARSPWVKAGNCSISLVEPKDHFLFTPLLYELITGELQRWEIAPSYTKLLQGTDIDFCQQKVTGIDLQSQEVSLGNDRHLRYDYLVLAVGCQNYWADIPGLRDRALPFRSLEDVENLNARLHGLEMGDRDPIRIAVIGGGANGVELACKLSDRLAGRGEIRLIERGDTLVRAFSKGVRRASFQALSQRRVRIEFLTEVTALSADLLTVRQGGRDRSSPVDLVLWATGTQTPSWLADLGIALTPQGKIPTQPTLQAIDYSNVFVLGDIASLATRQQVPATAQAAYQQASTAARNLLALMQGKLLARFYYLHLGDMLALGKRSAVISSFGVNLTGSIAGAMRRLVYVFRLPTFRHRRQVLRRLLESSLLSLRRSFRWQLARLLSAKSSSQ